MGLFILLVAFAAVARPAEDPPSGEATATTTSAPVATLASAKTIFVEPMSEGFDKFLSSELARSKDLYTVADSKEHADLWMKGVVTIVPVFDDGSSASESDLVHSKKPVKGMATVVVMPRDGKEVLWQGDARLFSVPGNRIPTMAKTIVSEFRKAVKDSRKSSQ